jgi:hypothetical protein
LKLWHGNKNEETVVTVKEIEVKSILTKTGVPASDYVINP